MARAGRLLGRRLRRVEIVEDVEFGDEGHRIARLSGAASTIKSREAVNAKKVKGFEVDAGGISYFPLILYDRGWSATDSILALPAHTFAFLHPIPEPAIRGALLCLALAFVVLPLFAQDAQPPDPQNPDGENLKTPPSWKVQLDKPKDGVVIGDDKETADIYFVNMTPGWHVTTGPAAICYHPASTAEGAYRAETTIHLVDPKGRNNDFGFVILDL